MARSESFAGLFTSPAQAIVVGMIMASGNTMRRASSLRPSALSLIIVLPSASLISVGDDALPADAPAAQFPFSLVLNFRPRNHLARGRAGDQCIRICFVNEQRRGYGLGPWRTDHDPAEALYGLRDAPLVDRNDLSE